MPRYQYSSQEYVNMVLIYAECDYDGARALRMYAERYPNAHHPRNSRVIVRALVRIRNNEPIVSFRCGVRPRPVISVRQEENVLRHFEEEPGSSTRRSGRLLNMSHVAVFNILKKNNQHPKSKRYSSGSEDNRSTSADNEEDSIQEPPKAANLDPCCSNIAGKALRRKIDVLGGRNEEEKKRKSQDSAETENEIKVFCPRCDTEVSHTAEGIQEDQIKILIANVYHYFEQEYEELKTTYGDLDLTPLSKFRQRTALATGVSEATVLQILKEEEGRNAEKREEAPEKRSKTRKRSIQAESSSEEDSADENADANEQSSSFPEAQTLVVKVEPSEYNEEPEIYAPAAVKVEFSDIEVHEEQAHSDPIALYVKTERSPQSDILDNTIETLALTEPAATKRKGRKVPRSDVTSTHTTETLATTEPAATKRKGKKIPRRDVTSTRQHTQGEASTSAASSSVRLKEELDEGSLFADI